MVNITCAAQRAIAAYSAAIALGGDYSYPLSDLGAEVSSFFLPNYTSFSLGKSTLSPNQSVVANNFVSLYTEWRENGPGTHVRVDKSRLEPVSNESALCWLTYRVSPARNGMKGWEWTNVYGFRMVYGGMENGLEGGWEFALADEEHQQYAARFPN
ncbi:hypothetical protein AK830_g6988 [Neonectria ditissima]|uniref:SnoaL-like domain-containing protein n=1 Tax=Neonectria ditissima TaxID=78410 RepID=A0A0P7BB67_9HYPO|nr:hypothetical protein AK830_g6988 [Neonectria ditissima]